MRLYGKEPLISQLSEIAAENRLPHAILLTGEKGSGKHTVARYISKLFLCSPEPCGKCPVCSKVDSDGHPDIIFALGECGGKYTIDRSASSHNIRSVLETVAIKPNDGDIKIYIFEEADTLSAAAQDTLLKNIEEPEPWVRYIFLCENAGNLLTTVRSRVVEYHIPDCPTEECAECLSAEHGVAPAKAAELSEIMSGNIGKCLEVLNGGDELRLMDIARQCAKGVSARNGYLICTALAAVSKRNEFAGVLEYLAGILRDALAVRSGVGLTSCGKSEAQAIARNADECRIAYMLDRIFEINSRSQSANLNLNLCAAYLTAELIFK